MMPTRLAGLIPAWAGKTSTSLNSWSGTQAHPRVGGENTVPPAVSRVVAGSSPRGRGKLLSVPSGLYPDRLIPAWAGKTWVAAHPALRMTAHPRVGGENYGEEIELFDGYGSSPRGRGKPIRADGRARFAGLIPAWAGKTELAFVAYRCRGAHPRVGGENGTGSPVLVFYRGSSPRGRGKHFLTCAFIERIGQILETLELAVSSESYTLSAAYATDAPQDQARNTALVLPSSRGAS